MGFLTNQLSPENFQDHLIKTLKVICLERVQRTDDFTVQLTGAVAPVGPLQVQVDVTNFTASIYEDKVFNIWTLNITGTDANGNVFTATTTYREDAVHCPVDLTQWPGQNVVQKHDFEGFQVVGPVDFTPGVTTPTVTFDFALRYCLVVAKEVLVKVNGAIPFC